MEWLEFFASCKRVDISQLCRTKQPIKGSIINSKDYFTPIYGVLYHETLPSGEKKITVRFSERKKIVDEDGTTEYDLEDIGTMDLKLDKDNLVVETKVASQTSDGKSVTTHNKDEGETKHSVFRLANNSLECLC